MAKTQEEMRSELIALLRSHDWSYEYSDDHGVYTAGRIQQQKIRDLIRQVPDGDALYAVRGKVEV